MSISPVNVAVIADKKITKAEVLSSSASGKTVKIKAVAQGKYILAEGENGVAPENITVKRVGKSLHVILEGSDVNHPDLIIEEFFDKPGELIGKAEAGSIHPFVSTDGDSEHDADQLQDGEISSLALGEENEQDLTGLVLAEGFDWSPALLALAGIAALAAAAGLGYLVGKNHNDNDKNSTSSNGGGAGGEGDKGGEGGGDGSAVPKPSINSMIDDVGSITGPIANGGRTDDAKPTLNGKGTPGNTIEIWDGKTKVGEAKVNEKGEWTFTPSNSLSAGEHSLTSIERDQNGKTSEPSDPWKFTVDLTAPAAGIIDAVVNNDVSPEKAIENGGSTNDTTPKMSGKAEADSTIEIWDSGKLIGTAITDKDGNWSFICPELEEGEHTLSAIVVDKVGNKSLPTPPFIVDIDTTPPDNSGIENIKDDDDNSIVDGGWTNDKTPTLEGKGEDGDIVLIYDGGKLIGSAVVDKGEWTFTPGELAEGRHDLEIIVVDAAGNESDKSKPVIIDIIGVGVLPPPNPNIPPAGDIDDVLKDNLGNTEISVPRDGYVNDPTLHIVGHGIAGNTVILYITGVTNTYSFTAPVDGEGKWSINTTELADDFYSLQVAFYNGTDTTGKSAEYKFEVDTIAPPKPPIRPNGLLEYMDEMDVNQLLSDAQNEIFAQSSVDKSIDDKAFEIAASDLDVAVLSGAASSLDVSDVNDGLKDLHLYINDY
jgi:hypothetical protein